MEYPESATKMECPKNIEQIMTIINDADVAFVKTPNREKPLIIIYVPITYVKDDKNDTL